LNEKFVVVNFAVGPRAWYSASSISTSATANARNPSTSCHHQVAIASCLFSKRNLNRALFLQNAFTPAVHAPWKEGREHAEQYQTCWYFMPQIFETPLARGEGMIKMWGNIVAQRARASVPARPSFIVSC
jgi:hypothetical protein